MSNDKMPDGWRRVKFGDVVRKVNDRVDPDTAGIERYVAGEHMDTDDLIIRRWGEIGDGYLGPAFHMRFRPGQVLYGSRRTYLRKVAVADFDGITANTTFVIEPSSKDLLPEFLPLLMTTEAFHEHSIKQSKGSVNPYINFSDLTWYEFALPPLDEQQRIVEVIAAVDEHISCLTKQVDVACIARTAVLSELLSAGGEDWIQTTLSEVMSTSIGGIWGADAGADEIDVFVYRQTEFDDDGCLSMPSDVIRSVSRNQLKSRRLLAGDILLQKSAGTPTLPGRVVIVPPGIEENATCSNFLQLIRADAKKCDSRFLFWNLWFRHKSGGALAFQRGTNIRNLDLKQYFAQALQLPTLVEQKRIEAIVSSMDEVIQSTEQAVSAAKNLRSGLLSVLLTGEKPDVQ